MVSVQLVRVLHRAVALIIRRSWVRAPPAPPAMAQAGRQPDSAVTVAQLLDQYVSTAGWDVSIREGNLGYIRRTIKPAIGSTQVRKVRGPLLDTLYARLMRCGNLTCTSKPFTEHRNIPDPRPDPADPRLEWQQAADRVRAASVVLPVPPIPNTTIPDGPGPIRSAGQRRCSPPPDEVPVFPSIQARDLWPDGPGATGALRSGSRTGTDPTAAKMVTAHSPSLASSLSGGRGG